MWVKALSACTQRSKQSLIVGTHRERKKKPATVYGPAIERGEGLGGRFSWNECESQAFGELRGKRSGKGRVDKSISDGEGERERVRGVRSCFCYYYRALVLSHLSAQISPAMTSLFFFHFQSSPDVAQLSTFCQTRNAVRAVQTCISALFRTFTTSK